MDVRKFVLKETRIITIGVCIGVAAMWGMYALLGYFDRTVLIGGIVGAILAVLNFFAMALSANMAADCALNQDVKGGKKMMQSFMMTRMLAIFVVLVVLAKSGLCNPLSMVVPFVMIRPTITVAEFFRKAGD